VTDPSPLTTAQAAEVLGASPAHVRRLVARGALPCEETPLGRLYQRSDDITAARGMEMYLALWLRLWRALGSDFDIKVVP